MYAFFHAWLKSTFTHALDSNVLGWAILAIIARAWLFAMIPLVSWAAWPMSRRTAMSFGIVSTFFYVFFFLVHTN